MHQCLERKFEIDTKFWYLNLGEAAGIGMGLVMLASKSSQAIEDMVMVCIFKNIN